MDAELYQKMILFEDSHWWYVGRRKIIDVFMRRLPKQKQSILEVGCGSGGNLELLSCYGEVDAIELDDTSYHVAKSRNIATVKQGFLPNGCPFTKSYDVIVMFDVLEHIEEDILALKELKELLSSNGYLVITVPALMSLWSAHDVQNHHFRRYTRTCLNKVLDAAGFEIVKWSYFNTLLFPLIFLIRWLNRNRNLDGESDLKMPSLMINKVLTFVFGLERFLVRLFALPIGVSLGVTARIKKI